MEIKFGLGQWNKPAPRFYRDFRDIVISGMLPLKGLETAFDASDSFIKHSDAIMVFVASMLVIIGKLMSNGQVFANKDEVKESVG